MHVPLSLIPGGALRNLLTDPELGARHTVVDAGTVILEPHRAINKVYFLQSGQVRKYQIGPEEAGRLVEILGPGEWFGTEAISNMPQCATRIVAVIQSIVVEMDAERFLSVLSNSPVAAIELLHQTADKLQVAREDAADLVFEDCNSRLLKTLLRFSTSAAATREPTGVRLHLTHQQLAEAVGVARETISLALMRLKRQDVLQTGRNQLFFDPDVLRRLVARRAPAKSRRGGVASPR